MVVYEYISIIYLNCKEKHVKMHRGAFVLRRGSHKRPSEGVLLQISGLKMKGGSVDLKTGELKEEADRELVFRFGSLQVDVGQQDELSKATDCV